MVCLSLMGTISTLLLLRPHCQVPVTLLTSIYLLSFWDYLCVSHICKAQEESGLPCGRYFSQRSLPAASVKGAHLWDEWVHLQLMAPVLPLAPGSATPSSLFCSLPLFRIAHLPLWMVSLLFCHLIWVLICHREKKDPKKEGWLWTLHLCFLKKKNSACMKVK